MAVGLDTTRLLCLIHLLRSTEVVERVVNILDIEDFDATERAEQLLWAISKDWYMQHRTLIPRDYLEAEAERRLAGDVGGFMDDTDEAALRELIKLVYAFEAAKLVPDYALEHLQQFINERRMLPAMQVDAPDQVDKKIDEISKLYTATRISTARPLDIFDHTVDIDTPQKFSLNFEPVNLLLGGGGAYGEIYGLLAPSGCGKTTLGLQLAVGTAKTYRHVAIFSYETDIVPEISRRLYSLLGGIPRDIIDKVRKVSDLPEQYRNSLTAAEDDYARKFLHVVDMKSGQSGAGLVGEIHAQLRDFDRKGQHIEFIVIDQLIPMVDRHMTARNMKVEASTRQMVMQRTVNQLMLMAQPSDMACCGLLIHQSESAIKKRPAVVTPKQGESMADKSFDNWMPYCMALGTHDSRNCCWLVTTKARNAARGSFVIRLDGKFNKFIYEKDRYKVSKAGFVDQLIDSGPTVQPMAKVDGLGGFVHGKTVIP